MTERRSGALPATTGAASGIRVSPAPASGDLGLRPVSVTPCVRAGAGVSPQPTIESAAGDTQADGDGDVLVVVAPGTGRFRAPAARRAEGSAAANPEAAGVTDHRITWAELPAGTGSRRGARRLEVVVDGWRFELEVEPEAYARLAERARRDRGAVGGRGVAEVRAMIPGRVLDVAVRVGDAVEAGQRVLVIEAMKMQNELRAPRAGVVTGVRVVAGQTVELGDLLLAIGDSEAASSADAVSPPGTVEENTRARPPVAPAT